MHDITVSLPQAEWPEADVRRQVPYPPELSNIRTHPVDPGCVVLIHQEKKSEDELVVIWSGHVFSGVVAAQVFPSAHEAEVQAIMGGLVSIGQEAIAERIGQLDRITADEGEELDTTSLWLTVDFLRSDHGLGMPEIGATPAGEIQLVWRRSGEMLVAMDFMPNRLVRYTALCMGREDALGSPPRPISGVAEHPRAMAEIKKFLALLDSP